MVSEGHSFLTTIDSTLSTNLVTAVLNRIREWSDSIPYPFSFQGFSGHLWFILFCDAYIQIFAKFTFSWTWQNTYSLLNSEILEFYSNITPIFMMVFPRYFFENADRNFDFDLGHWYFYQYMSFGLYRPHECSCKIFIVSTFGYCGWNVNNFWNSESNSIQD